MPSVSRPFLAEFSESPSLNPKMPELELDAATGLLRRLRSSTAFIEEILTAGSQSLIAASTATLVTESGGDSPDPDLVRVDFQWDWAFAMASMCTKTGDGPDPDLVRASLS